MDTDKLGKAEDMLNELLASGTNSLNVFNTLGVLYRKKGDIKEAMKQYKKALKIHPDEPYIYYNIGRLYLDMNDTTKAKTYFQAALDKDHGFEEAKQVIKAIDLGLV
jgi:tetratricopeptide (TPR) repeat protein